MSSVSVKPDPFVGKTAVTDNGSEAVLGGATDTVFTTTIPGLAVLVSIYSDAEATTNFSENMSEINGVLNIGTKHDGALADFYYYPKTSFSTFELKIKNNAGFGKTFKWFYLIYR